MKKFVVLTWAVFVYVAAAQAGVEFVGVNAVSTTYDAGSGTLSMSDNPLAVTIKYDDSTQQSIDPAGFNLTTHYASGMLFTGGTFNFMDESVPSVILSGDVLSVQFEETAFGYLVGNGTAEVLSSNLAGFPKGDAQIVSITFNLDPVFTDFNQDYTGASAINFVAPAPEPATMTLLALGGLALLQKRR